MRNLVQHEDTNKGSGRGLSGGVFRKLPLDQARDGLQPGSYVYTDFLKPPLSISAGRFDGFDLSHAGVGLNTNGGEFNLDPGSAVNAGLTSGSLGNIDVDSDSSDVVACEFRVKISNLAAPIVVGFSNDPDDTIDSSGLSASQPFIGVVKLPNASVFKASLDTGGVITTYGNDSETVAINQYMKLGVRVGQKYDKSGVEAEFYVNGSRIATVNKKIAGANLVDITEAQAFCLFNGDYQATFDFAAAYGSY